MSLEARDFIPAPDRPYIPREGFYPDARYQLSVAPHPDLSLPDLTYISLNDISLHEAASELSLKWWVLKSSRVAADVGAISPNLGPEMLPFAAFAPNTEVLFKNTIVTAVKKHALKSGKKQLAVDCVSYLFPFWSREELGDDIEIVEGELARLIKEGGTLPDTIGMVYLDFPPNQQKRDIAYDFEQLVRFIRRHPSALFIVDQANLYFSGEFDSVNDLMFTTQYRPPAKERLSGEDNLVIVTNSTTKAIGSSGCALAVATKPALDLLNNTLVSRLPVALGFDENSFMSARQVLELEIVRRGNERFSSSAYEFRQTIVRNRDRLIKHLEGLFGVASTSPELVVGGARIIINAESLGFENAEKLCEELYRRFSIATKPASVYASPTKAGEFGKYVHMTIPWNEEIMTAALVAFDQLKNYE